MTDNRKYITNIITKQGAGCICPARDIRAGASVSGIYLREGEAGTQSSSELRKTESIMFLPKHCGMADRLFSGNPINGITQYGFPYCYIHTGTNSVMFGLRPFDSELELRQP